MGRSSNTAKGQTVTGEPLLRVAAERVGLRKAFRVLSFMVAWDMATDALGYEPSVLQYAEHWREAKPTAYRDQVLFREAFPGEETPARLMRLVGEQADARSLGAALIPVA